MTDEEFWIPTDDEKRKMTEQHEHVHIWMISSVGGVYLAICNALDEDGNATCEAQLTSEQIDERLNTIEMLIAEDVYADIMEGR